MIATCERSRGTWAYDCLVRAALTELAGTLRNGSRSRLNGAAAVPEVVPTELGHANTGSGDRRGGPQPRVLSPATGLENRTVSRSAWADRSRQVQVPRSCRVPSTAALVVSVVVAVLVVTGLTRGPSR